MEEVGYLSLVEDVRKIINRLLIDEKNYIGALTLGSCCKLLYHDLLELPKPRARDDREGGVIASIGRIGSIGVWSWWSDDRDLTQKVEHGYSIFATVRHQAAKHGHRELLQLLPPPSTDLESYVYYGYLGQSKDGDWIIEQSCNLRGRLQKEIIDDLIREDFGEFFRWWEESDQVRVVHPRHPWYDDEEIIYPNVLHYLSHHLNDSFFYGVHGYGSTRIQSWLLSSEKCRSEYLAVATSPLAINNVITVQSKGALILPPLYEHLSEEIHEEGLKDSIFYINPDVLEYYIIKKGREEVARILSSCGADMVFLWSKIYHILYGDSFSSMASGGDYIGSDDITRILELVVSVSYEQLKEGYMKMILGPEMKRNFKFGVVKILLDEGYRRGDHLLPILEDYFNSLSTPSSIYKAISWMAPKKIKSRARIDVDYLLDFGLSVEKVGKSPDFDRFIEESLIPFFEFWCSKLDNDDLEALSNWVDAISKDREQRRRLTRLFAKYDINIDSRS